MNELSSSPNKILLSRGEPCLKVPQSPFALLSASKGPLLAKVCYNRRQTKRVTHISSPLFTRSYLMSKKLTSTILLFAVFIGFLCWGLSMLISNLSATVQYGASIVYSLMLLGCSLAALVAILMLPRRNQP